MAAVSGSLPDPEKLFANHRGPYPFLQHNILSIFSKNKTNYIKSEKVYKTLGNKDIVKALKRLNKKLGKLGLKISKHNVYLIEEVKSKPKNNQMGLF